jgi:hypothetical protein
VTNPTNATDAVRDLAVMHAAQLRERSRGLLDNQPVVAEAGDFARSADLLTALLARLADVEAENARLRERDEWAQREFKRWGLCVVRPADHQPARLSGDAHGA